MEPGHYDNTVVLFLLTGGDSAHEPWSNTALQRQVAGRREELPSSTSIEARRLSHTNKPAETTQSHEENTCRWWSQLTENV